MHVLAGSHVRSDDKSSVDQRTEDSIEEICLFVVVVVLIEPSSNLCLNLKLLSINIRRSLEQEVHFFSTLTDDVLRDLLVDLLNPLLVAEGKLAKEGCAHGLCVWEAIVFLSFLSEHCYEFIKQVFQHDCLTCLVLLREKFDLVLHELVGEGEFGVK